MGVITATLFSDPACPWAYSANPALRVLEWRYGDQLDWRLVTIGLREDNSALLASFDPARSAARYAVFHRLYGMPFTIAPKERPAGTGRGCRAIVAARLLAAGQRMARAARPRDRRTSRRSSCSTTTERIREALRGVPGLDADAIAAQLDSPEVVEAYERDKAEARSAAGTPAEAQGKTSTSDGPVRYTAPSVIFEQRREAARRRRLAAVARLRRPAREPRAGARAPARRRSRRRSSSSRFPDGLVTAEVAALIAPSPDYVSDRDGGRAVARAGRRGRRGRAHPVRQRRDLAAAGAAGARAA